MSFRVFQTALEDATSLQDYFPAALCNLRKVLGPPTPTEDRKVQKIWRFIEDDTGEVCTLYSWKEDGAVRENESYPWHVGARDEIVAKRFIDWLSADIKAVDFIGWMKWKLK